VTDRLLVLAWHAVEATWGFPCRPGAGVRGLARQLQQLQRMARIVPLEPALDALRVGRPLPPRAVALTFDDGYRDHLALAAPLLERLGLPATFFLVPSILAGDLTPWWEVLGWSFGQATTPSVLWQGRLLPTGGRSGRRSVRWVAERLKLLDRAARDRQLAELVDLLEPTGRLDAGLFLDWAGAKELCRRGFTVGSHTLRHPILSRETAAEQAEELAGSRHRLEVELGVPVRLLAYPNGKPGDYDEATVAAAEDAGYRHALTTRPGLNTSTTPALELCRVVLEPHQGFCETVTRRVTGKAVQIARVRLPATRSGRPAGTVARPPVRAEPPGPLAPP
jgi:peptidoglycan/xylan/chitin deacetylase (PgdA/CDA1 family)